MSIRFLIQEYKKQNKANSESAATTPHAEDVAAKLHIQSLENQVEAMSHEPIKTTVERIKEHLGDIADLASDINIIQAQKAEIAELRAQNEALRKENNSLKLGYEARKNILQEAQKEVAKLRSFDADNKGLKECNVILTEENEALKQENTKIENERDQLKQDFNDLQERFNGIKFIESELRKELAELSSERNRRDEMRKALEAQMGISKNWQP